MPPRQLEHRGEAGFRRPTGHTESAAGGVRWARGRHAGDLDAVECQIGLLCRLAAQSVNMMLICLTTIEAPHAQPLVQGWAGKEDGRSRDDVEGAKSTRAKEKTTKTDRQTGRRQMAYSGCDSTVRD
ncbi:hypothetical protein FALCPG4_012142 [Fusarium falciforme]